MPHLNGVGSTSAWLREAAPAYAKPPASAGVGRSTNAGRPLAREAKASPTQHVFHPFGRSFTFTHVSLFDTLHSMSY